MRYFARMLLIPVGLFGVSTFSCATLRAGPFDVVGVAFDKTDAEFQEAVAQKQPELVLNLTPDRNYEKLRSTLRVPTRVVGIITVRQDIRTSFSYFLKRAVAEGSARGCDFVVEYAQRPDVWPLKYRSTYRDYLDWQFTCEVQDTSGGMAAAPIPVQPMRHCSRTSVYGEFCYETLYPYTPLTK